MWPQRRRPGRPAPRRRPAQVQASARRVCRNSHRPCRRLQRQSRTSCRRLLADPSSRSGESRSSPDRALYRTIDRTSRPPVRQVECSVRVRRLWSKIVDTHAIWRDAHTPGLVFGVLVGGLGHRGPAMLAEHADVAQLVEHHLAKVRVAGSNPVVRSKSAGQGVVSALTLRSLPIICPSLAHHPRCHVADSHRDRVRIGRPSLERTEGRSLGSSQRELLGRICR